MKTLARSLKILATVATLPVIAAAPASGHETRAGGPVRFVVG